MSSRLRHFFTITLLLLILGCTAGIAILAYLEQDLPDVETLKHVRLQVPLRIYSADNQLIGEYGETRRIPVQLEDIPKPLINAIIATEDRRFWDHSGIDVLGLTRAALQLIATGNKTQGGSTITMQVARNFFLTRKKTYVRKVREILLSLKMTRELSKEKVLELYLNKVYFGQRAYGVAAAAQIYYGAKLEDLTLAQMAMLAGLPQAPSSINPLTNPEAAIDRRHHVLQRMLEQQYITQAQFNDADKAPITASRHFLSVQLSAPYVAEEVRDELVKEYGTDAYSLGLSVYTTIDSRLQKAANEAVRTAVLAYDKRHGYRLAIANWGATNPHQYKDAQARLQQLPLYNQLNPALILNLEETKATALLANGQKIPLTLAGMQWAGKALSHGLKGAAPKAISDVINLGDVIYVEQTRDTAWQLSQVPQAEGALIAINPNNGSIQAMVGGFSYVKSKFDRVMQAKRQPGSGFKPFIYSAALDKGLTLATLVNDAPIVTNNADNTNLWRPQNDSREFYGPTRLRVGLTQSRNLVTIRLLSEIGIDYAIEYMRRFGFDDETLPRNLPLALGTGEVTLLQLARGYASFANGGYKINPYLVHKILDSNAKVIKMIEPEMVCDTCEETPNAPATSNTLRAKRIISPQNAYLITSALQSVIQEGTGKAANVLNRHDLAGKTGSTQDLRDAWFNGFNRNLVVITWMGFDQPQPLYEHGAQAALPMWIDFMRKALKGEPETLFPRPANLVTMRINPDTGEAAGPNDQRAIFETFRQEYAPKPYIEKSTTNGETVYSGNESVY